MCSGGKVKRSYPRLLFGWNCLSPRTHSLGTFREKEAGSESYWFWCHLKQDWKAGSTLRLGGRSCICGILHSSGNSKRRGPRRMLCAAQARAQEESRRSDMAFQSPAEPAPAQAHHPPRLHHCTWACPPLPHPCPQSPPRSDKQIAGRTSRACKMASLAKASWT